MGYYTAHTLYIEVYDYQTGQRSVEVPADTLAQIVVALADLEVIGYALHADLSCCDAVKWYDHDTDMVKVSKQFPGFCFAYMAKERSPEIFGMHII